MGFSSLKTFNFRNLSSAEVKLNGKDIFLVGENGQGKSNFLEAIYFCSYASSFRGASDKELVCAGENECSVQASLYNAIHEDPSFNNTILIKVQHDKKSILIDGKNANERKELLSLSPTIVFCHEDMRFITGSPEQRRWFFDQNLCLCDEQYIDDLRKYKKILKTRNTLLKEIKEKRQENDLLLDVIDPQLAEYGLRLMQKRRTEIKHFATLFGPLFKSISGIDNIDIEYESSWKSEDTQSILCDIKKKKERELFLGSTVSGPHRDNYHFTREGADFSKKASTGQKRLLALLLRVVQAHRYYDINKKKPVLLLDDVLLELDGEKKIKFLSILPDYDQAFYTFLPEEPYHKYKKNDTLIYSIQDGIFKEE
jgi:DNA replication and repair protein RecF